MTRPRSNDLCERVVDAMPSGESCRRVGGAVRCRTVKHGEMDATRGPDRTGSVARAQMGGYRRALLEPHRAWLLDQVRACPHITLAMLQEKLVRRGGRG